MSSRSPSYSGKTAASPRGGCHVLFLLTPFSVLLVGLLMAFTLPGGADMLAEAAAAMGDWAVPVETNSLAPVFTREVDAWVEDIHRWATAAGLDPNLLATVMQIESCGDPKALSPSGAMGLFQVMPYHFLPGENGFHPDTNALRGSEYLLRSSDKAAGDMRLTFAGYNGGIGVIGLSDSTWSDETVRYAYWGSGIYADAVAGKDDSGRLQEWLQAGGARLCRQAAERLGLTP